MGVRYGVVGGAGKDHLARALAVLGEFNRLTDHGASGKALGFGFVDDFQDETNVDTVASTGETYDSGNDCYYNDGGLDVLTGTPIGDMTSNGGLAAAFDSTTSQIWNSSAGKSTGDQTKANIGLNFGTAKTVAEFQFYGSSDRGMINGSFPTVNFELQGSATGAFAGEETVLYSSSFTDSAGVVVSVTSGITATAFQYVRVHMGEGNALNYDWHLAELVLKENIAVPALVLQSEAFTAEQAPADGDFIALLEPVDAVTLGTDVKAYLSQDGGTTWAEVTLDDRGDAETGISVIAGSVAPGGSGTSLRWKIETFNDKKVKAHAVALLWE